MIILKTRVIEGRNVWTHSPVLVARLYLAPGERKTTDKIPGFAETVLKLLPGLAEHTCGRGYPGGFAERLREGTMLGLSLIHI